MNADELVSKYIVQKFQKARSIGYTHTNPQVEHIATCPNAVFISGEHGWECGCYSSYTRDDQWWLHGVITCDHDRGFEYRYSTTAYEWDGGLPGFIREMIRLDEENFYCSFEEYNEQYGS